MDADLYKLVLRYNAKGNSLQSISKTLIKRNPKSEWPLLINNLYNLKVLTLPDYRTIPGYFQLADGDVIIVEISSKSIYRFYSYQEPHLYEDKIQDAKQIEEIMGIIENEFSFRG